MKKLIPFLFLLLALGQDSFAGVSCSVPFNLTNGTLADASQVMANYNAILACLANNTAESGANSSIMSLSGLTTPLSPAQGGTSVFVGTTSGGTNAITVGFTTPNSFSLTPGNKVIFTAGGSNTAATTLAVGATAAKNLFRMTPAGPVATVGGEIVAGQIVEAVYDGTQFQMTSHPALDMMPGVVFDYAGAAGCPVGSLLADGSNQLTATFPAASSVLSTSWGNPGGAQFTLPDLRGRATFSATGASNRITVAGGNFDGTVVGNVGGRQNQTLTDAQLPVENLTFTGSAGNLPTNLGISNGLRNVPSDGATYVGYADPATETFTPAGTISSFGGGTSHPVLSNAAIVLKCVKM